ncbi:MAG: prepilin-type N-terminal cleavage/methylation domain-containing protein [Oscillospiraceae bacterium]|nr:prepilin-type N-terminal cleavage/methylation domain-containing protein [Oscillospiraceae bacterium]
MKKNIKLRAFTLIEVLIALFILALSSLVLVTAYASVYAHVKSNTQLTDRMSEQQSFVENKKTTNGSGTKVFDVICDTNVKDAYKSDTTVTNGNVYVTLECVQSPSYFSADKSIKSKPNFRINCALYTVKNLENGDGTVVSDNDELNVDFKYFEGSNAKK